MDEFYDRLIPIEKIQRFIRILLKNWKIISLLFLVCLSLASYEYLRRSDYYFVDSRILIKDNDASWGQEYFIDGMELISERNSVVNEIGVLKSYFLLEKAVKKVPELIVTLYEKRKFNHKLLYKNGLISVSPIEINNLNTFYIKTIGDNSFLISDNNFKNDQGSKFRFGQKVHYKNNIFLIIKNNPTAEIMSGREFEFYFNDPIAVAKSYQKSIIVNREDNESTILNIGLKGESPIQNIDVINAVIESFLEYRLKSSNQVAVNTIQFVDERMKVLYDSLNLNETRIESLKKDLNIEKIDLKNRNEIPSLIELEKRKLEIEFQNSYYSQTIDYIQNNDDAKGIIVPYFVNRNSALYDMMKELIINYTKLHKIGQHVTTTNLTIDNLKNEIKVQKSILVENLTGLLRKGQNDLSIINGQVQFLENKLIGLPEAERDYINTSRDYKVESEFYDYLLEKKNEAELAQASNIPKVIVLDYADKYRSSNLTISLSSIIKKWGTSFLIIAILVIFLIDTFNNKIESDKDIKYATNIPLIGKIGFNDTDSNIVLKNNIKTPVSESFRAIRSDLKFLTKRNDTSVISITSSVSSEGKTFCSLNIALAFALLEQRVIIIDTDLRRPSLHKEFKTKNDIGLTSILIGLSKIKDVVKKTKYKNLDIIPSGKIPPNPSELLSSTYLKEFINELKENYDYIIIDTSPIGIVSDSKELIEISDVILMVVREGYSKISALKELSESLSKYSKETAVIMNNATKRSLKYYKSYNYY